MDKTLLRLCAVASLAITPWTTFDPINPPKFLLLSLIGSICAVHIFQQRGNLNLGNLLKVSLALLLVMPIISAVATNENTGRDLYGAYGRLFGLITLVCLVLVLSYFSSAEHLDIKDFFGIFQVLSLISISYGFLQSIGRDFAPWENPYSPIVGFLGNPNFMSSLTGVSVILLSYWYVGFKQNILKTIVAAIFQFIGILIIIQSDSIQGLFVVFAGILSGFMYVAIHKRKRFLDIGIVSSLAFSFLLIALAISQKGPFANVFASGTLANRIEYWKTGLRMFLENWQFGVGPDQFGTWFRFYRPESTTKLLGTEVITDSPHNSIIEFGANFGIVGLIAYLILVVLVFSRIISFARNSSKISIEHMLLSGAFIGYFAQTLISPNQIGLTIWGWVFMGLILNKAFSIDQLQVKVKNSEKTKVLKVSQSSFQDSNKNLLSIIIGGLIGLIVSFPLFYQHILYRNALVSSDAVRLIKVAESWPRQEYIQIQIVEILMQNQHWVLSHRLNSELLQDFPNSYLGWQKFYENKQTKLEEKEIARKELHRLDPLNQNWK